MTIDLKTIKHISKLSRISVDEQKAEMENINTRIANTQRQLNGFTSKGIQNDLIFMKYY